jgi:predicted GNAT superfamily acetyltransferase
VVQNAKRLVRCNEEERPIETDFKEVLSQKRVVIEIPNDITRLLHKRRGLGRRWRLATWKAFTEALGAGFVIKEFCHSIRGHQRPGAYLLER